MLKPGAFKPKIEVIDFTKYDKEAILFDTMASEFVDIAGFKISYYIHDPQNVDRIYGEDPLEGYRGPYSTKLMYQPEKETNLVDVFGIAMGDTIVSAEFTKTTFSKEKEMQTFLHGRDLISDLDFSKEEVEAMIKQHLESPHLRHLQKVLARDLTIRVHSETDFQAAIEASEILFGKGTTETLRNLDEKTLLSVFEGVPTCRISISEIETGIPSLEFLADKTNIFPSKGEARRMMKDGGVLVNKEKVNELAVITTTHLLNHRYVLVQKGKKNYYLVIAE